MQRNIFDLDNDSIPVFSEDPERSYITRRHEDGYISMDPLLDPELYTNRNSLNTGYLFLGENSIRVCAYDTVLYKIFGNDINYFIKRAYEAMEDIQESAILFHGDSFISTKGLDAIFFNPLESVIVKETSPLLSSVNTQKMIYAKHRTEQLSELELWSNPLGMPLYKRTLNSSKDNALDFFKEVQGIELLTKIPVEDIPVIIFPKPKEGAYLDAILASISVYNGNFDIRCIDRYPSESAIIEATLLQRVIKMELFKKEYENKVRFGCSSMDSWVVSSKESFETIIKESLMDCAINYYSLLSKDKDTNIISDSPEWRETTRRFASHNRLIKSENKSIDM